MLRKVLSRRRQDELCTTVCEGANTECNSRGCSAGSSPFLLSNIHLCFQVREEKTNAGTEVQSSSLALWGSAATTLTLEGGEATKKPEMRANQEGAARRMQPTSSLER